MKRTTWLDRRIAAPGPQLALCLDEAAFKAACKHLGEVAPDWIKNPQSHATAHVFVKAGKLAVVVCMRDWQGRDPVEVAGLLIHEAVHIWQEYVDNIGERFPGAEQEAYAIQAIAQELLADFARQIGARR